MTERVLVTGGAGFIGSHLCAALLERGDEVTVIDNLSTGRFENVERFARDRRFRFVKDTVLREDLVERLVEESDRVYHLASSVGVRLIMERPVETVENMIRGGMSVFDAASRFRKPVLFTSTSEVYGKSNNVPFEEDGDRLEGPTSKHRWAYACAKAMDEFLALAHWKESRLPVVVVRLFNTVGPRQTGQYGMVVPKFVAAALRGEDLTVHGDGKQSRCFGHVSDVIRALTGLSASEAACGHVFNVGSNEEISILNLAKRVIERLNSKSKIRMQPYSEVYGEGFEDMPRRVPSIVKINKLIGWKPEKSLDQTIDDVAATMRPA